MKNKLRYVMNITLFITFYIILNNPSFSNKSEFVTKFYRGKISSKRSRNLHNSIKRECKAIKVNSNHLHAINRTLDCSLPTPTLNNATTTTGSATYVANNIDISNLSYNGGTATVTYNLSVANISGADPTTFGLPAYQKNFSMPLTFSDVIPTDAIASPQGDFGYSFNTYVENTVGDLDQLTLELHVDVPNNTLLAKNINWVNTGLYTDNVDSPDIAGTYNNTISGTAGVGPLTVPAYVANTSTNGKVNGNWVTSLQYKLTSGSLIGSSYYPLSNPGWQHFNSGSAADGGEFMTSFAKDWSFDEMITSSVIHNPNEVSTAEIVLADNATNNIYSGYFGITNDVKFDPITVNYSFQTLLAKNTCPASKVNLNELVSSTTPGGSSLVWFTSQDHSGSAYSTPTAADNGTYYPFYYDSSTGCYSPAMAKVTVDNSNPSLSVTASGDCSNSVITLSASNAGTGVVYSWTGPNGYTSNLQNPTPFPYDNSNLNGTYTVNATLNGCSTSSSTIIDCSLMPLPVKFESFTATDLISGVQLNWKTSEELNNDHFEVQRSSDAMSFETIAKIKSSGNSNISNEYSFLDKNALGYIIYYRLKSVDLDQTFDNSKIISVIRNSDKTSVAYPNPVNSNTLVLTEFTGTVEKLTLTNNVGFALQLNFNTESDGQLIVNLPNTVVNGNFLLTAFTQNGIITKKIIINR